MRYLKSFLISILLVSVGIMNGSTLSKVYYPLEEELSWVYQISLEAKFGVMSGTEKMIITNFPPRELKRTKVVPQKVDMLGQTAFAFVAEDNEGIYYFARQSPDSIEPEIEKVPVYFIRHPIKIGTTWETEETSVLLEKKVALMVKNTIDRINEIVTVPAGTFDGCMRIKSIGHTKLDLGRFTGVANISIESYSWYAPGIGLVKSIRNEKSNHLMVGTGKLSAQLESYPDDKLKNIKINPETISMSYKPSLEIVSAHKKKKSRRKKLLKPKSLGKK